jgi:serine/threonine protein kinase
MALQPGQSFGNYQIVRLIGEGGFGEVYLAENPLIERRAAVKVLHPSLAQDAELVRRFLNEARAASAIRHPNIIEVFDAGATPAGAPYILMEFLDGVSLQKRLADHGRLPVDQVLQLAGQAGSALSAAHAAGIVHRDLKPENMFLIRDASLPGGERVKVLDFGIAKIKQGSGTGGTMRTQTGLIMGSPAYMSPEQCKDSADVDHRSDIYSFATILYQMLAGKTPYVAGSGTELLIMHLTETPRPLHEVGADVPVHVEAAIMRGLARERNDRFATVAAFLESLRPGLAAAVGAVDAGPAPSAPTVVIPALSQNSRVGRTAILPATTTFSRATGEVGAAGSDEAMLATGRSRRWIPFAIAGAALLVTAIVLLVRPSHHVVEDAAPVRPSPVATPAAEFSPPTEPAVLPAPPDAGPPPTKIIDPPRPGKRAHAAPPPALPAVKKRSSDDEWIAH